MGGKARRARLGPRLEVNCVAHGIVHHVVLHAQARHLRQHNAAIVALVQRVAAHVRAAHPADPIKVDRVPAKAEGLADAVKLDALDPRGERLVSERVQEELRAKLRRVYRRVVAADEDVAREQPDRCSHRHLPALPADAIPPRRRYVLMPQIRLKVHAAKLAAIGALRAVGGDGHARVLRLGDDRRLRLLLVPPTRPRLLAVVPMGRADDDGGAHRPVNRVLQAEEVLSHGCSGGEPRFGDRLRRPVQVECAVAASDELRPINGQLLAGRAAYSEKDKRAVVHSIEMNAREETGSVRQGHNLRVKVIQHLTPGCRAE